MMAYANNISTAASATTPIPSSGGMIVEDDSLDFISAMKDFRTMFPGMDEKVIEQVLRTNNGGVDDTIDQLLAIQLTEEPSDQTIPKQIDDLPDPNRQMYLNMPPQEPILNMNQKGPSLNVNAGHAYNPDPSRTIQNIPDPNCISPDLLIPSSYNNNNVHQIPRQSVTKMSQPQSSTTYQKGNRSNQLERKNGRYRPPLVGPLPKDFLRLVPPKHQTLPLHPSLVPLDPIYDELQRKKDEARTTAKQHQHQHQQQQRHQRHLPGATLGVFQTGSTTRKSHKGLERSNSSSGMSARRRKQYEVTRQQAEQLKIRMAENQWERQVATDPEIERYLEDERVAMMLQNREFMKELRRNKDFLSALERDAYFSMDEQPAVTASSHHKKKASSSSSASTSKKSSTTDGLRQNTYEQSSTAAASPIDDLQLEGYGHPGPESVSAFPYTRDLGRDVENEAAFSERLRYMGKNSKQRFALMARKFVRKSKGAKGVLGASDSHYSGANLLDEMEGSDTISINNNNQHDHSISPPSNATTGNGYNQPDDHLIGIGQGTDLKEGRLFSR